MTTGSVCRSIKHTGFFSLNEIPPAFLVPALQWGPFTTKSHFSTSAANNFPRKQYVPRKIKKDNNPDRGVSGLRRTGLKNSVAMSKVSLPQPVLDPKKRSKLQVDEHHGLWGFFNKDKKSLSTPEEDHAHGMFERATVVGHSCGIHELIRVPKVERGPWRNCATNLGKIYIACGGYVSRNVID